LVAQTLLLEAPVDSRVEQHGVDRLRQVVLRAHLEAPHDTVQLVERRRHDHRDVAEMRVAPQLLQDSVPVELRHQDVEQHQVEAPASQQLELCQPAARLGELGRVVRGGHPGSVPKLGMTGGIPWRAGALGHRMSPRRACPEVSGQSGAIRCAMAALRADWLCRACEDVGDVDRGGLHADDARLGDLTVV